MPRGFSDGFLRPIADKKGGGGLIKSKQSGIKVMTATVNDVTISKVDLTKAVVLVSSTCSGNTIYASVKGEFLNDTTIRLSTTQFASGAEAKVYFWVIEFNNVKSLQRGSSSWTAGSYMEEYRGITISDVNPLKCLVFLSKTFNGSNGTWPYNEIAVDVATNALMMNTTGQNQTFNIYWQVLEFI